MRFFRTRQQDEVDEMLSFLFVYDDLMRGKHGSRFLQNPDRAAFVAAGSTPGVLYDFGSMPALVPSSNSSMVEGEIYELFDPETSFHTLDLIAGYWENEPERSFFVRKPIKVTRNDFQDILAWAYVFNFSTKGLKRIEPKNYHDVLPSQDVLIENY